jgi:hypothetical protein
MVHTMLFPKLNLFYSIIIIIIIIIIYCEVRISALRSFTLTVNNDFLCVIYQGVSPLWSRCPGNSDSPGTHISLRVATPQVNW